MRKLTMTAAILGTVGALALAGATPAAAHESFGFSFSIGDVDLAYRSGYYDRWGRWHFWASPAEMRRFRAHAPGRFRDRDWDGVPDRFDRDRDGDGIPNYADRRPNRFGGYAFYPSRRDWDGDGVPNRWDARPRNPYRW